jgi:TatD DNase family protein
MSFGIHPQIVAGATLEQCSAAFEELNAVVGGKPERLVAIGEIGLDAATPERKRTRPLQEDLFRQQLALARAHELPVVLHILRAHGPALALLRRDGLPQAGGVVHSYSGPLELVRDYTALGLYISFATSILGDRARRQHGAAAVVPRDRLLVETDAPFQAPPDVHPEANRPAVLPRVVDRVAKLRGEHSQDVAAYTALNARRLFRL